MGYELIKLKDHLNFKVSNERTINTQPCLNEV